MRLTSTSLLLYAVLWEITATPFQPLTNPILQLPSSPTNLTHQFPPSPAIPSSTLSAQGSYNITCDGDRYGHNPDLRDCQGAHLNISPDTEQQPFAERDSLPGEYFSLPFVSMGDKALCFFQPVIIGEASIAHASLNQIRGAAGALLLACGSTYPSQGGIIKNIGGDNNLAVTMNTYTPHVTCKGRFRGAKFCESILSAMPASTDLEVFGPIDTVGVKEVLPQELASVNDQCVVTIFRVTDRPDIESWFRIWQAIEAVAAVCARQGMGGSARGLGHHGNISLTLGGPPK